MLHSLGPLSQSLKVAKNKENRLRERLREVETSLEKSERREKRYYDKWKSERRRRRRVEDEKAQTRDALNIVVSADHNITQTTKNVQVCSETTCYTEKQRNFQHNVLARSYDESHYEDMMNAGQGLYPLLSNHTGVFHGYDYTRQLQFNLTDDEIAGATMASKCHVYRLRDDVSTFIVKKPTFRFDNENISADKIKLVACTAKVPQSAGAAGGGAAVPRAPPQHISNPFRLLPAEVNQLIFDKYILHRLTQLARKTGGTGNFLDLLLVNKELCAFAQVLINSDQHSEPEDLVKDIHTLLLSDCRILNNPNFNPTPHLPRLFKLANAANFRDTLCDLVDHVDFKSSAEPKMISSCIGQAKSHQYWDEVENDVIERKVDDERGFIRILRRPTITLTEESESWGRGYLWTYVIIYGAYGYTYWIYA
ncbi:hypothetical protein HDV00_003998 [Rhizophlyctis rosea]|nr:hypothetical protein HDV00_003998 [Rhizophlyctis rosea]